MVSHWHLNRRLFAKNGYSVALLARGANEVNKIANEINASGGHVSYALIPQVILPSIICSRLHHSHCLPIPMNTSPPRGRPFTQNSLNLNISFVLPFLTLGMGSGSHFLTSRLKISRNLFKPTWPPHSPLPAAPFWRSRTTISNNRMEKEAL